MEYYESDFIRYLEIERTLRGAEKDGDDSLTPVIRAPRAIACSARRGSNTL
jgi:hypothetical protein